MQDMSAFAWITPFAIAGVCQVAGGKGGGPSQIELVSPKGKEEWSADSQHYLLWNANPDTVDHLVTIEYTTNGGKGWETIAESSPNSGRFLWKIPDLPSTQCRVRITDQQLGLSGESTSSFSILPSQEVRDYHWENVTNAAAFAPRDGAGALAYKGKMWLLGGWNPGDKVFFPRICNNEVWCSTDGLDWQLVKPNTFIDDRFDATADWEGRHTAGYVVHDGKMWILGGDVNQGHYQNDVWNSTDGVTWNLVNKDRAVPWGPRSLQYTLAFKGKIWVMGGQTLPQFSSGIETVFHDDIWNTTDGLNWTRVVPKGPHWCHRGMIGGSVVFQDRMWVLGGGTYDTPDFPQRRFHNDVWSSPDGVHWEQHTQFAPWEPRQYHDVAVFDDRMWVMEGWNQQNRKDVWYSSDGVNWYELPNTPWNPRHAASAFVYDNALWMVAGNNMESDAWKLKRTASHD